MTQFLESASKLMDGPPGEPSLPRSTHSKSLRLGSIGKSMIECHEVDCRRIMVGCNDGCAEVQCVCGAERMNAEQAQGFRAERNRRRNFGPRLCCQSQAFRDDSYVTARHMAFAFQPRESGHALERRSPPGAYGRITGENLSDVARRRFMDEQRDERRGVPVVHRSDSFRSWRS